MKYYNRALILGLLSASGSLAVPSLAAASTCSDSLTLSVNGVSRAAPDPALSAYAGSSLTQSGCEQFALSRAGYSVGISLVSSVIGAPSAAHNGQVVSVGISGTLTYNGVPLNASGNIELICYYDGAGDETANGLPGYVWDLKDAANNTLAGTQTFSAAPVRLSAGFYHVANGDTYYTNGIGQYCAFPQTMTDPLTSIAGLNVGSTYVGFCWGSYFPVGVYSLPAGQLYYSNGAGAYCYLDRNTATYPMANTPISDIPPGNRNDGTCAGW